MPSRPFAGSGLVRLRGGRQNREDGGLGRKLGATADDPNATTADRTEEDGARRRIRLRLVSAIKGPHLRRLPCSIPARTEYTLGTV